MNKGTRNVITVLFVALVTFMIILQQLDIKMITFDIFNYYYAIAAFICFGFLKVFWKLPRKQQDIILCVMPIVYLLTFDILIIVLTGFMGLTAVNRYERTRFVKITRVAYLVIIAFAMFNVAILPATFYGFQEDQLRVYRQYPADDGEYMVEILDYKTASNGPDSTYTIRFFKKDTPLTKRFIAEVERNRIRELEIEWIDNENIEINEVIYSFEKDEITSSEKVSNND